jgi:protein-L-isoaspartate(D-aspartate) O-methyltransferase
MKDSRVALVKQLWDNGHIKTEKVKQAMLHVPREEFMPRDSRAYAYLDRPLPIGKGQTISAPHMVAILAEKLALEKGMKILEIGAGFGYNAAVVSEIVGPSGHVYTMERIQELAVNAQENLDRTGYGNSVTVIYADGTLGYPEKAPFDRIYATASAPKIPKPLKGQLKIGGRLLSPIGPDHYIQELVCILKISEDEFKMQKMGGVAFVPMIGEHGWPEK